MSLKIAKTALAAKTQSNNHIKGGTEGMKIFLNNYFIT